MTTDDKLNMFSYRETVLWDRKKDQLPVTLITGFLGSGKTTLVRYILSQKKNLKIAVEVNDLAEINIDSQTLQTFHQNSLSALREVSDGCACCSRHSVFEESVCKDIKALDTGHIDYVVMETSGVTDPHAVIHSLQKSYGKLYRAYLDTVVTVVDAETALHSLTETNTNAATHNINLAIKNSSVFFTQLQCADVVLLNKTDLISDTELIQVTSLLSSYCKHARIFPCQYGIVPLQKILGITTVESVAGVVTHDNVDLAYQIRKCDNNTEKIRDIVSTENSDHLIKDDVTSILFSSLEVLDLAKFIQFIRSIMDNSQLYGTILRMKGTLWLLPDSNRTHMFNMSGQHRYDITLNPKTAVTQQSKSQLIIIGTGLQKDLLSKELHSCCKSITKVDNEYFTHCLLKLKEHIFFEFLPTSEVNPTTNNYIDLRVLGCEEFNLTPEQASKDFGVNFNKMNSELCQRVNLSRCPYFIIPIEDNMGHVYIRIHLAVNLDFNGIYEILIENAQIVKKEYFRAVKMCKCGW